MVELIDYPFTDVQAAEICRLAFEGYEAKLGYGYIYPPGNDEAPSECEWAVCLEVTRSDLGAMPCYIRIYSDGYLSVKDWAGTAIRPSNVLKIYKIILEAVDEA